MADAERTRGLPAAFGPQAELFLARFPFDVAVIAADASLPSIALAAAMERRLRGDTFFVAPLLDDPRALAAQRLSGALFSHFPGEDERRRVFDLLADATVLVAESTAGESLRDETDAAIDARARTLLGLDDPAGNVPALVERFAGRVGLAPLPGEAAQAFEQARRVLRDLALAGDALLVRSRADEERVARLLVRRRAYAVAAPFADRTVPRVASLSRTRIVVWAPHLNAEHLGVIAMALNQLKCDVSYVCAGGTLPVARGEFVDAARGAAALATAACIVDASIVDPGPALALAELGLPLAAAATSGAGEYIDGLYEYDPANWRSVLEAVSMTRGAPPPAVVVPPPPAQAFESVLQRAAAPVIEEPPLVSLVTVTYNRPHLLRRALAAVAAQRYDNVEVVVVNNGTEPVESIVREFPFARLVNNATNVGFGPAMAQGLAAIRGKYFGVVADDDMQLPGHLRRLVDALERSGAWVAHGNTVSRFLSREGGKERVLAHKIQFDRGLDPLTILAGATMTEGASLFRTDLFEAIGPYDGSSPACDRDFLIRASQRFDFIHVDAVTFCWEQDVSGSSLNYSDEVERSLRELNARYPTESKIVGRIRAKELERFSNRHNGLLWPPDAFLPEDWQMQVAAGYRIQEE